ncbi:hypothetical protein ACFZAT_28110 [Streptomyces sp. NPDC008163]|uniref:hypothetical protein n=1 Tax=Streptomyces sp. NPDC008163 TaxID=3364818 RepID=UPI0036F12E48
MPRPTAAQLSYGSVTVVFSTLAMLLLFRTSSGLGIAVVGTVALALGLAVSVTVPAKSRRYAAKAAGTAGPVSAHRGTAPAARDEDRAPVSAQSLR